MQTSEVLNKAGDHVQEFGHRKFALGSAGEPTCALGSLRAVIGDEWMPAAVALYRYLGGPVHDWNNAPERTAAEVIEVLRATALIEAAKENAETRQAVSA